MQHREQKKKNNNGRSCKLDEIKLKFYHELIDYCQLQLVKAKRTA